jgi:hypothetical protein
MSKQIEQLVDLDVLAQRLKDLGFHVIGAPRITDVFVDRIVIEVLERCPCKPNDDLNRVRVTIKTDIIETVVKLFRRHLADDEAEARGEFVDNPAFNRVVD